MNETEIEQPYKTSNTELVRSTTVRTKNKVEFDASADHWKYSDEVEDVSLDFSKLRQGFSSELIESAKATMRWYAANLSSSYLINLFNRLLHFERIFSASGRTLSRITAADLLSYKAQLDPSTAWYLGAVAAILKKWRRLGYPGVDSDVGLLLKQLRIQGNAKGVAVLTMDPEQGPYTHIEEEGLQSALNSAYAEGRVQTSDYVMAWLYILLGQRNKQYAALKVCDVQVMSDADGNLRYSVMMPRAKKGYENPRVNMVVRPLIEQFGEVLVEYAKRVRQSFEGVLTDTLQAPLFPDSNGDRGAKGYEFHRTAANLGRRLKNVLGGLSVQSERTGQVMHVNARRFRRTIGTRAAEEGHGPLVIARLLDHTDTQHVGVYTANSPIIIDRIDRAIAMKMAPLAQAFAGTLVVGNSEDPTSAKRIIDLRVDRSGKPMGKCGKDGSCGFAAPIACYTCKSFIAWRDGPHEAVLAFLLARREKLLQTTDKRMAAVNDRTIYAVAAVIIRITELILEELNEDEDEGEYDE